MNQKLLSTRICLLLILLFGIGAYSNTFNVPFQLDDTPRIVENHSLRPPLNLGKIWESFPTRVVANLSFAIQYALTGLAPWGFHCVNLLIHLFAAMLVFVITQLLLRTPALQGTLPPTQHNVFALAPALLFLTHPIQTQSVTYIVQRMTSLATLFYLAALWMYLKARLEDARHYRLVFLFMVAALLTKEFSFTLPFAILLTDFCFFPVSGEETISKKLRRWIPFAAFLLFIPLIYLTSSRQLAENLPAVESKTYRWDYLLTQFRVIRTYLRLLFFPTGQCLIHDIRLSSGWGDPDTWSAFALLLGIFTSAILLFKKYRLLSFGILCFFLTLSPESSFFPIIDVIFEHRLYLPMFGFSLFIATFLWLFVRSPTRFLAVILMISIVLSALTYSRNEVWESRLSLAWDTVKKSPLKGISYAMLGDAYRGNDKVANIYYQKAFALGFATPFVYLNLADTYDRLGEHEKSLFFRRLISSSDASLKRISFFDNHALALIREGKNAEAVEMLKKDIEISPDNPLLYIQLGEAYRQMQRESDAVLAFRKAIALDPLSQNGYDALALFYKEKGEKEKAVSTIVEYLKYKKEHKPLFE